MLRKKIKKIMLVFPTGKVMKGHFHRCELPLGLAYLAAAARADFDVGVIDGSAGKSRVVPKRGLWEYFGIMPSEILRRIEEAAPDAVGISCVSSFHFPETAQLCRMIKKLDKSIVTITGGTHPTFLAGPLMPRHPEIDFIVLQEGEETFRQLLQNLDTGRDYRGLDGLAYRENGTGRVNRKTRFIEDLDTLPFPARELFPLEHYERHSVPFSLTFRSKKNAPVITSRGCTAPCVFCASRNYWGRRFRARSPQNVLDEIERLIRSGIKEIQFIDDNLTLDKERARRIFRGIIERNMKIFWNTPNGIAVWTIDEEMLELMKESGCYELTVAFESGDQDVLDKIIKKPVKLAYAEKMVKKMKRLRIQVHSFFISGFPGEKKEQMRKSFALAKRLDLDSAWFFIANPTPGSELLRLCREKGCLKKEFSFEDVEYNLPHIETEDFTGREVEKLVLMQFNAYNLGLLLRHPVLFFRKYLRVFLAHPVMSVRTIWVDMVRVFSRDETHAQTDT